MSKEQSSMRPQDIVVLLKIASHQNEPWLQIPIAKQLGLSQSEMSKSLNRSKYAGLIDESGRKVRRLALVDFIQFGLPYAFPQRPGSTVRGVPTAHSAPPLNGQIQSDDDYVWPYAKGSARGQSVIPLYKSVPEAVQKDPALYELLALVDAIRLGNTREKKIAISEMKNRILN